MNSSPEETGDYRCDACGNVERFTGHDARGFPGKACECGEDECTCEVELTQDFDVIDAENIHYECFEGGGNGSEIGCYTKIVCRDCDAIVWEEAAPGE